MAKKSEERYRSAGELANSALNALTAPEQHQAVRILQQGEDAANAETMARPAAAGAGAEELVCPARRCRRLAGQPTAGLRHPEQGRTPPATRLQFPTPQRRDRNRKLWILIGAAVVLLVAVFGYLVRPHGGPATPSPADKTCCRSTV